MIGNSICRASSNGRKAARGGLIGAVFPWGDEPDPNRANYRDSGIGDTSAVGCFAANGNGLFDMAGDVWEWTCSAWKPSYRHDSDNSNYVGPPDAVFASAFLPPSVTST